MIYPIKKASGVREVSVKDEEDAALCGKTCNKAHAAVALQSLCSCRCFGSRTSKFSIHCTVLKVSLHHVAAGRFSREIFKGLQRKG